MFLARSHGRTLLSLPPGRNTFSQRLSPAARTQQRHIQGWKTKAGHLKDRMLETPNEIAAELAKAGPWGKRPGRRKNRDGRPVVRPDNHRVHVTSQKLVDDIVEYMGDSLLRHKGCDIIDIFPGAGVWSKKLNEVLQPRSHILMEPEAEVLYKPFLEPMLDRPGVQLVPYSGVMWDQLGKVLSPEYLPHQVPRPHVPPSVPLERNDTLLVTANLSFYPKKIFQFQDNMAQMVVYQLIQAIRTSTLFYKYGLVRMLIWTHADEVGGKLPRCIQNRRRATLEMELNTEYMHEIAGGDFESQFRVLMRSHSLDLEGGREVIARMRDQGIRVPQGRETELYRKLHSDPAEAEAGPVFQQPLFIEALELHKKYLQGLIPDGSDEFKLYRRRINYYNARRRNYDQLHSYATRLEALEAMYKAGEHDEATRLFGFLAQEIDDLPEGLRADFILLRDNVRAFKNRVLYWDRRQFEPLQVQPLEFFPNAQCSLMDIQPKSPHRLLREVGKRSSRSGDYWDLLLRRMYSNPNNTVTAALNQVYAGAADGILPECSLLYDPAAGGSPFPGWGECTVRSLSEEQYLEILEKWVEWPFKPTFYRFLGASEDSSEPESNMWVE